MPAGLSTTRYRRGACGAGAAFRYVPTAGPARMRRLRKAELLTTAVRTLPF
jgi:hypothetical protein